MIMHLQPSKPAILFSLALVLGLGFLSASVQGQIENHLILKKKGYINKMHFLSGDPITFVRQGNDFREETYIQGIGSDFIIVSGRELPIRNISSVEKYRSGFNFKASGKALMIAAPGYLVIGAINELFHQRDTGWDMKKMVPDKRNLIVAGSLLAIGAILPAFQVRNYPIGKNFTLRIVQSDPAFNR